MTYSLTFGLYCTMVYKSVCPVGVGVHGGGVVMCKGSYLARHVVRGVMPPYTFPLIYCVTVVTDAARRRERPQRALVGGVSLDHSQNRSRHANARRLNASHHPTLALYYTIRDSLAYTCSSGMGRPARRLRVDLGSADR